MRKKHSANLKFKIALEALNGKSIIDICRKYQVSQSLVHRWKTYLLENGGKVFGEIKSDKQSITEQAKLYQQIGELTVEVNFLKKVLGE
jgi:transposase-like protein